MNPKKLLRKYNKKNIGIGCSYSREWAKHINQLSKGMRSYYKMGRTENMISAEAVDWLVGSEMEADDEDN